MRKVTVTEVHGRTAKQGLTIAALAAKRVASVSLQKGEGLSTVHAGVDYWGSISLRAVKALLGNLEKEILFQ